MTKRAEKMLRIMDRAVMEWHIPVIGREKGRVIRRLLTRHGPTRGIEVGSLVGYSAILIASGMPRGGKLTCVENNPYLAKFCQSHANNAGLKDRVKVVVGDALRVLPFMRGPVDFMLLDAQKEDYLDYLKAVEPRLVKGALIIADNTGIYRRDVKPYLDHVRDNGRYTSREYGFGFDCMEVSVYKGSFHVQRAPRPRVPQAPLRDHGDPAQAYRRDHLGLSRAALHPGRPAGGAAAPLRGDPRQDQGLPTSRSRPRARRSDLRRALQRARGDGRDAGGPRLLIHVLRSPPGTAGK